MGRHGEGGLPVGTLVAWLAEHGVEVVTPATSKLISGGRSNLTYALIGADGHRVVVRRPPHDGVLATAHDMGREWRFITALQGSGIPVAEPLAWAEDAELIGAPFYVMSYVDGLVPHDVTTARALSLDARHRLAADLIDTMVRLHRVDIDEVGLDNIAKREDYIGRQLRRWKRQWDQSICTDITAVDAAHDRLEGIVPPQDRTGIVHGDFRLGNMMCSPEGEIRAVLDWELATLGDPLADLGWLLSYWLSPSESGSSLPDAPPTVLEGFPSREWLVERYAQRSAADVSMIDFYLAFAHWRSACISAGVLTRYESGVMGEDGFDSQPLRAGIVAKADAVMACLDRLPA